MSGDAEEAKPHSVQAGILVLGRALAAVSEAVVLLLIVRLLGKTNVGVLAALLLVYETTALVSSAGFPAALMYFLPTRTPAERSAIARRFTRIMVGLAVFAAAVLVIVGLIDVVFPGAFAGLTPAADGEPVSLRYLIVLALYPLADMPARLLPNLLVIEGRAKAAAGIGVFQTLGRSLFTILPVVIFGEDLWAVVTALVIWGFIYVSVLGYYLRTLYRGAPRVPSPVGVREIFKFAIPLGLTQIVGVVNNRLDRYLILATSTAAIFAEYQAGAWQIPFIVTIPYAVGAVYTPHFRKLFAAGKPAEAIAVWRLSVIKVALIVVPVTCVFVVAAEETVTLLFTEDYAAATSVFRIYCVYTLGRVAAFGNVIVAAGRPGYVFRAAVFSFLSNIALSVPLVLMIGFDGPAWGTALAFIPTVIFYCWCIGRAAELPLRRVFPLLGYLRVLVVAAIACGAAMGVKLALDFGPGVMLMLEALTVIVTYAIIGTLTRTISSEDWSYVRGWLKLDILR